MALLIALFLFAETVTVSWYANTESDLAGYHIYLGTESKNYDRDIDVAGSDTMFAGISLQSGTQYFFAVTAYDTAGNESDFSEEVIFPDNRPPNIWQIVFLKDGSEEIILEIEAHGDETQNGNGWTVWGHEQGNDSGLFILNPDFLSVRVTFQAKLIGNGSCLDEPKLIRIGSDFWEIDTDFKEIEFTSNSEKIFINYFDDCWIPNESDANLRIENIKIFK